MSTPLDDAVSRAADRWVNALDAQVLIDPEVDPVAAADAMTALDDARVAFVRASIDLVRAEEASW